MATRRAIVYIANVKIHHLLFNLPIMKKMKEEGFQIFAIANDEEENQEFKRYGIKYLKWKLDKGGKNIFEDLKSYREIYKILKRLRPEIVHTFTIKPNIYAVVAAKKLGVKKIIPTVTGLGYLYTETNILSYPWRKAAQMFYSWALRQATDVIFFNDDDQRLIGKNLNINTHLIEAGAGIDTKFYCPRKKPEKNKPLRVLTICRLLKHKGIVEFMTAAKTLNKKFPNVEFVIAGEYDPANPSSIKESELEKLKFPELKLLGQVSDIRPVIAACDIFVLASYREGLSRSTLEAISMEKPIVATNVPGCKQLVKNRLNGFVVPRRDVKKLAAAIKKLIKNKKLRLDYGAASRKLALEKFSVDQVISQLIKIYDLTPSDDDNFSHGFKKLHNR